MNQIEFIKSKEDDVLELLEQEMSASEIALELLRMYPNYEVTNTESFKRACRKVIAQLHSDLRIQKRSERKVEKKLNDIQDTDEEQFEKEIINELEYQSKYMYLESSDTYFFFFQTPPITLSGKLVRELKKRYSNMTSKASTINEICREFKITRRIFVKVKTILGWTHDDDPFTLEELNDENFDIDDAVESLILQKKHTLSQKFQKEDLRIMSEAAKKWWRFERNEINPFVNRLMEKLEGDFNLKKKEWPLTTKMDDQYYACVLAPFDLHYGKYASKLDVGEGLEYNKEIAKTLLFESLDNIINHVCKYPISRFIVPIGSDFFHVDTPSHTTTRGTPQDMDGTFVEMASEGNALMIEFIDTLKQIAPVHVILCAGNHDYSLSHQLLEVISAWYRNDYEVEVNTQRRDRTYIQFGNCMLGFTHGDGAKLKDLPNLMMRDDKKTYGTTNFHAMFHGHLHYEIVRDYNGVKIYQMPSLAGSDRWHHKNGYEYSVRGLPAYIIDPKKGVVANILENII